MGRPFGRLRSGAHLVSPRGRGLRPFPAVRVWYRHCACRQCTGSDACRQLQRVTGSGGGRGSGLWRACEGAGTNRLLRACVLGPERKRFDALSAHLADFPRDASIIAAAANASGVIGGSGRMASAMGRRGSNSTEGRRRATGTVACHSRKSWVDRHSWRRELAGIHETPLRDARDTTLGPACRNAREPAWPICVSFPRRRRSTMTPRSMPAAGGWRSGPGQGACCPAPTCRSHQLAL
jgi:hypothetical protein